MLYRRVNVPLFYSRNHEMEFIASLRISFWMWRIFYLNKRKYFPISSVVVKSQYLQFYIAVQNINVFSVLLRTRTHFMTKGIICVCASRFCGHELFECDFSTRTREMGNQNSSLIYQVLWLDDFGVWVLNCEAWCHISVEYE